MNLPLQNVINVVSVLALAILGWCAICYVIAVFGGWRRLAECYAQERPFRGRRFRMQSAGMRWGSSYSGALTVGASEEGLSLAVLPLFRPGHAPLFIPWRDVRVEEGRLWWRRVVELRFARAPEIPVRIFPRLAAKLANESGGNWPAATQARGNGGGSPTESMERPMLSPIPRATPTHRRKR